MGGRLARVGARFAAAAKRLASTAHQPYFAWQPGDDNSTTASSTINQKIAAMSLPPMPKVHHPLLPLGKVLPIVCSGHMLTPAELVDKCVGSQIWIIMNNQKGVFISSTCKSWADDMQSSWAS
jgi:hypothetical protein